MLQHRLPPAIGGTENHVWMLAKELAKRGHDITIYTTTSLNNKDVTSLELKPPFIKTRYISSSLDLSCNETTDKVSIQRFDVSFRILSFNIIPSMFSCLAENVGDFDLIHGHVFNLFTNFIGCYYAKKYKKPFILTAHDLVISDSHPLNAKLLKKLYDSTFGKYVIKNSAKLIALTESQIREYIALGADRRKIEVIPNAVELKKYGDKIINSTFLERYRIKNTDEILLFVGRIEKYKHIQDVIEIMPNILKKHPNAKFMIVGEDYGFKNNLEGISKNIGVEERVMFTGSIPEGDLLKMYQIADIFVFPSKLEGFGIVLLEAMAIGTPCVVRSIPTTKRVIQNGKTGFLVKNKDEFIEKILYLLENDKQREVIQKNALKYVERYSTENVVDMVEKLYNEVVN
jgi:glycosyltransferase involved in cell wall biosynthesis